jgi:phosphate transport system substrate-binding protein
MRRRTALVWSMGLLAVVVLAGAAVSWAETPQSASGDESQQAPAYVPKPGLEGTLSVSGAWALYPMVVKWAEEFQKIYPKVKIDISAGGAGKGMADALAGVVDIGMVSREVYPAEIEKGAWWVAVTKDAVVPTVNAKNPFLADLMAKGVKRETFIGIWIDETVTTWGQILGTSAREPVHVYTRSDACGAADTWAAFMGEKQEGLVGIGVYGDPGLTEAVKRDNLGIGFNNIGYAYDAKTLKPLAGIMPLPIDVNGNGRVDPEEDTYATRDDIVKAIADGRYPSPPARDLNFVCRAVPTHEPLKEFIGWALTEGQKYVPEAGYINLPEAKIAEMLARLEGKPIAPEQEAVTPDASKQQVPGQQTPKQEAGK